MTSLKGDLRSIMGTPFGGVGHAVLIFSRVTRAAFNSDSVVLQLHDRIEMPEEADGKFRVDGLDPGPIRIELEGGTVHNHGWNIDLPDEGVWSLTDLVDAQVDWSPAVIGRAEAAAREARDHADRAEAGADRVGTAEQVGVWASEASASASSAASAESGAITARNASQSARDAAEGHANRASTSESNAKTSETNAKQSETNAGDFAAVATTAATEAVDAMDSVSDIIGAKYATQEYVDSGKWLRPALPSWTDLNAVTTPGIHPIIGWTPANSMINRPDGAGAVNPATLTVTTPQHSSGLLMQVWQTYPEEASTSPAVRYSRRKTGPTTWTAWENEDMSRRDLPSGTNVDTYVRTNGRYNGTWVVSDYTITGLPVTELGVLEVYDSTGFQTFMGYTTGFWFRRINSVSNLTWSPWQRLDRTDADILAIPGVAAPTLSRTASLPMARSLSSTIDWTDYHVRMPLPYKHISTEGLRVSFRNIDLINDTTTGAPVTITSVYVGKGKRGGDGKLTGEFASAPTALTTSPLVLPTSGASAWTPWGAVGVELGEDTIISYGISCDGSAYSLSHGACWRTSRSSDASELSPSGMGPNNVAALTVTAEIKTDLPKVLVIGDSHMVAANSDMRVYQSPATLASTGGFVASISAVGGTRLSGWATTNRIWDEVSWYNYDKVLVALGSNDIWGGGTPSLSSLQGHFLNVVGRIRARQKAIPIVALKVWPRNKRATDPDYATVLAVMEDFNDWLETLPGGISGVGGYDNLIDPSTGVIKAKYIAADETHLNTSGNAVYAHEIRQMI